MRGADANDRTKLEQWGKHNWEPFDGFAGFIFFEHLCIEGHWLCNLD